MQQEKRQSASSSRNLEWVKTCLFDLPGIALIGAWSIISQWLRARKIMVRAWSSDDVALAGDLAGKAGNRARNLINLAEKEDTREAAV
jgi:hypothetical protein